MIFFLMYLYELWILESGSEVNWAAKFIEDDKVFRARLWRFDWTHVEYVKDAVDANGCPLCPDIIEVDRWITMTSIPPALCVDNHITFLPVSEELMMLGSKTTVHIHEDFMEVASLGDQDRDNIGLLMRNELHIDLFTLTIMTQKGHIFGERSYCPNAM